MANKKIWLGMLLMALAFGITFIGCDNGGSSGGNNSGGGSGNNDLNGTWVSGSGAGLSQLILNNGNFEMSMGATPLARGTYTTSGNSITVTPKEANGEGVSKMFGYDLGLGSKWYSKAELKAFFENLGLWALVGGTIDEYFAPQTGTYSLSNNGNTLNLTLNGQSTTYTRK